MPEHSSEDSLVVTRFFEGDLSPDEKKELASRLKTSPALRTAYLEKAALINLLAELPEDVLSDKNPKKKRPLWLPAIALTAAAGIVAAIFLPSTPSASAILPPQQAAIKSLSGALLVDGKPASLNAIVSAGQTVQLNGDLSSANLTFSDGSQLLLTGKSEATLLDGSQKGIKMERGTVHASVCRQKKDSPLLVLTKGSRLEVPATVFSLETGEKETRFVVNAGQVTMRNTGAQSPRTISTGQSVTSLHNGTVSTSSQETPPYSWRVDFEKPGFNEFWGSTITEDLPPGSQRGAAAVVHFLPNMGRHFYQIGFRDQMAGICQTTSTSHLEMTFRTGPPYWFNTFIHAVDLNEGEVLDVKIYKLDPKFLKRSRETRDYWHRAVIPLSAFRERGDGSFNGSPPEQGLLITTLYLGSPEPGRELRLDDIAILPDGNGELLLEPLSQ